MVGGLLVDDLVVEGAGGTGWAAVPLVLRDLLLASPSVGGLLVDDGLLGNGSLICDGLFVDELVREGAVPPVLNDLP